MARAWNRVKVAGVLTFLILVMGCAGAPIAPPNPPSFRMVVLDLAVPDAWRNPTTPDKINKEMKGWWFGARDVWHNPGMGQLAADIFAQELNQLPFIHMVSRMDTKYYLAGKRDLIRKKLEERRQKLEESASPRDREEAQRIRAMTDADYDRLVEQLPPYEIGRELKVDRVLIGRIYNIYLAHNRTIHWYWSSVDLEVSLMDVDTHKIIWTKRAQYTKNFSSTSLLLEVAAQNMIEAMKRGLFYQP